MARATFHQLPLRPNGYINISWLPPWLVTDTLMSRPRAAGHAPREKTEFKRLKHSTSLPAPQVGELKASSLARVSGDSHFSGIDPWVFHLPGTLQGAAGVRSVQDESGRPRRGQVQGIWMQRVLLVGGGGRRVATEHWFVSFTDHWSPREVGEGGSCRPCTAPCGWSQAEGIEVRASRSSLHSRHRPPTLRPHCSSPSCPPPTPPCPRSGLIHSAAYWAPLFRPLISDPPHCLWPVAWGPPSRCQLSGCERPPRGSAPHAQGPPSTSGAGLTAAWSPSLLYLLQKALWTPA